MSWRGHIVHLLITTAPVSVRVHSLNIQNNRIHIHIYIYVHMYMYMYKIWRDYFKELAHEIVGAG